MNIIKKRIASFLDGKGYGIVKVYKKNIRNGYQVLQIGDFLLKLPVDHDLPEILYRYPEYSKNLPRIVEQIVKKYPDLNIVDVGANVGDTVALINERCKKVTFSCVEGNPIFLPYIKENLKSFNQAEIIETFLSDIAEESNEKVISEKGSARIVTSESQQTLNYNTLDNLSKEIKRIEQSKLLKIDTDGFDFRIIRGGLHYIEKAKPILFFEYDRDFLNDIQDDGFSTLDMLFSLSYNRMLIYDHLGRLILPLSKFEVFKDLDRYIKGKKSVIPYYDICLFHESDEDLFNCVLNCENQI